MLVASTVAATVIVESVSGGTARDYDTHPASPAGGGEDAAVMSVGRDRRTCFRVAEAAGGRASGHREWVPFAAFDAMRCSRDGEPPPPVFPAQ